LVVGVGIMAKLVTNLADGFGGTSAMRLLTSATSAKGGTTSTRQGATVATAIGETTTTGNIEAAVTLARMASVASSYMSNSIGEISGGHLLLESHLMGQEKTVNVITRNGIDASSYGGNQGIKLKSKTGQQEGNSLKIIEGLATGSKGVTESFQFMKIVGDR
jgi:hypothetical protein